MTKYCVRELNAYAELIRALRAVSCVCAASYALMIIIIIIMRLRFLRAFVRIDYEIPNDRTTATRDSVDNEYVVAGKQCEAHT